MPLEAGPSGGRPPRREPVPPSWEAQAEPPRALPPPGDAEARPGRLCPDGGRRARPAPSRRAAHVGEAGPRDPRPQVAGPAQRVPGGPGAAPPPLPGPRPSARSRAPALTARVRPERHQHEVVREPRHGEGRGRAPRLGHARAARSWPGPGPAQARVTAGWIFKSRPQGRVRPPARSRPAPSSERGDPSAALPAGRARPGSTPTYGAAALPARPPGPAGHSPPRPRSVPR